jgi:hypothetical protein
MHHRKYRVVPPLCKYRETKNKIYAVEKVMMESKTWSLALKPHPLSLSLSLSHPFFLRLGQTVFDEVCTLFTGVLLVELQRECSNTVRDFTFQEVLLAKPLNIITWPFIARSLLIVLRQNFKAVEVVHVFNAPATEREVRHISYHSRIASTTCNI